MARLIALLLALLATTSPAQILRYTENDNSGNQIALGYPVPLPVQATNPVAGFRDYERLIQRLEFLALQEPDFRRLVLGNSRQGRPIVGFLLSDAADDAAELGADGLPLTASVLHSGGIHAREWASPEVVAFLPERMIERLAEPGIERYLADQLQLLWVPVLNPDGFLTTQAHPDEVRGSRTVPRDGRMRRKNLRDSDGDLATAGDTLEGVDLNRNLGPFWATANQSSSDPEAITYKGPAEESEAETQALLAAAASLPTDSLRLFIDTHSFGRVLFYYDENDRLGDLTASLATKIGRTSHPAYFGIPTAANQRFGSTDEHFAFQHRVPAYTLEIEPGGNEGAEYGGNAVSHSGFILPDSEITRVREEIYTLSLLAYYQQAGPAILEQVELHRSDGSRVFEARWLPQGTARRLQITPLSEALRHDIDYRLSLRFNKPMRWRNAAGAILNYPGQTQTLSPEVRLTDEAGQQQTLAAAAQAWQRSDTLRYEDDSWQTSFRLDPALDGTALALEVTVRDLAGQALDADPATAADWQDGHWVQFEDDACTPGDRGGSDRNLLIATTARSAGCQASPSPSPSPTPTASPSPAPTASPAPTPGPSPAPAGGGSGSFPLLLWLLGGRLLRRRRA